MWLELDDVLRKTEKADESFGRLLIQFRDAASVWQRILGEMEALIKEDVSSEDKVKVARFSQLFAEQHRRFGFASVKIEDVAIPHLVSIQVAMPQRLGRKGAIDPLDRPWHTAFHKLPITGPVRVGRLTVAGDGQADLRFHGGPDRPILAYCADHYDPWREELHEPAMPYGGFGENFTITSLNEQEVCLGDQYSIGGLRVEVSQPRQPCSKLARRWNNNDLPARVIKTNRGGWYFRVLDEATVEAGMAVQLLDRPYPKWTIARAMLAMYRGKKDAEVNAELAGLPPLSVDWREIFAKRVEQDRRELTDAIAV